MGEWTLGSEAHWPADSGRTLARKLWRVSGAITRDLCNCAPECVRRRGWANNAVTRHLCGEDLLPHLYTFSQFHTSPTGKKNPRGLFGRRPRAPPDPRAVGPATLLPFSLLPSATHSPRGPSSVYSAHLTSSCLTAPTHYLKELSGGCKGSA